MTKDLTISGRLVGTGQMADLELRRGRVASVQLVGRGPACWVAPGFIDIQVNGYSGFDVNAADPTPQQIEGLAEALWAQGVTRFCPTVVTGSPEHMCLCLEAIYRGSTKAPAIGRSLLCAHVEGPAISPEEGPRGVHPVEHVRPPSAVEYERWQEAAHGSVGIITLAPESPGAIEFIRARYAEGIVMAIGHTAATSDQVRAAVNAGARLSTHLGNGSHSLLPRLENYVWEQMADDRLFASLIFDGHHLPPAVMKVMVRAKGVRRALLVSDSVALAGSPPGHYETAVGNRVELEASGRLKIFGKPYLAGSLSSLLDGVANGIALAGLSLAECVSMVSVNPARLLRLQHRSRRPTVRAGAPADLTVFAQRPDGKLTVEMTVVGGDPVYKSGR